VSNQNLLKNFSGGGESKKQHVRWLLPMSLITKLLSFITAFKKTHPSGRG
jgi:hypothetical protein